MRISPRDRHKSAKCQTHATVANRLSDYSHSQCVYVFVGERHHRKRLQCCNMHFITSLHTPSPAISGFWIWQGRHCTKPPCGTADAQGWAVGGKANNKCSRRARLIQLVQNRWPTTETNNAHAASRAISVSCYSGVRWRQWALAIQPERAWLSAEIDDLVKEIGPTTGSSTRLRSFDHRNYHACGY